MTHISARAVIVLLLIYDAMVRETVAIGATKSDVLRVIPEENTVHKLSSSVTTISA